MITKQKIKHLERSVNNLRGGKTYYCIKKTADEEIYSCGGKVYDNQDSAKKDINFLPGDILVTIVGMGIDDNVDKSLVK